MVSLLLATVIGLFNSTDGLTFTHRENDDLTFFNIDNGKLSKQVTTCLRVGLMKEHAYGSRLTLQLGEIENGQMITVDFRDGRKVEFEVGKLPEKHWRSVGVASSERYIFEYLQYPSLNFTTKIYRIGGNTCPLVCNVPGRVVDVLGSTIVVSISDSELECRDINHPEVVTSDTALVKRLKRVYAVRHKTSHHHPFRYYDLENVRLSHDGKLWFEANHNLFGAVSSYKTVIGDVILSERGIEWQWKSDKPYLFGCYFLNDHTFRFCRGAKFMMGDQQMKSYEPGVYEVNLQTKRAKKLSTRPMPSNFLIGGQYLLRPQ